MAINVFDAARLVCERGSWRVTNFALQKILYVAQMIHLGRTGERLINTSFEAWEYGPVSPELYRKVRAFGDKPVQDIFHSARPLSEENTAALNEACDHLLSKRPGELVAFTHWQRGAWAKNYIPGARGIPIPDADIISEYRARTGTN